MNWLSPQLKARDPSRGETSAKLTFGIPPFGAELTFSGSPASWLARVFRRERISDVARITHARAHVHIQEDDNGDISAYCGLANMGRKPMTVEQVTLEACLANGQDLRVPQPTIEPPRDAIDGRSVRDIYMSIALGAGQIRHLVRLVQPATNRRSTPRVELTFKVAVHLQRAAQSELMRFTTAVYLPELLITCPSAPPVA